MTQLNFARDVQGFNTYAPKQPDIIFSATLTNGSNQSITVPSSYKDWVMGVSYQPGTSTYVCVNGTAAIPVGGAFAATNSELNPPVRLVIAGDVINFVTDSAFADMTVSLWNLPVGS